MATADQYIEQAAKYIGISGTNNIFNQWYWGHACYDPNVYPWCACFQSYVGVHDLKMPFKPSASASGVATQGKRVKDSEARKGDWVLFNWDGRQSFGWADHIGVVEWFDHSSGLFGTIEGNTGSSSGGEVKRVTRNNNANYATAFYRPPYEEGLNMNDADMRKLAKYIAQAEAEYMVGDDAKAQYNSEGEKGGSMYRNNYNVERMTLDTLAMVNDKLDKIAEKLQSLE